jgi:hypothetical protein
MSRTLSMLAGPEALLALVTGLVLVYSPRHTFNSAGAMIVRAQPSGVGEWFRTHRWFGLRGTARVAIPLLVVQTLATRVSVAVLASVLAALKR